MRPTYPLGRAPRLALAALGGLVLAVAFPRFGFWPGAVAAVALLSIATQGQRVRSSALTGLVFGLAFSVPTLSWTGIYVGAFPWLLLSTVVSAYYAMMAALIPLVAPLRFGPIWVASLWTLQEAVRGRWPFGGFGWGRLAFSQSASPLRWLATLAGAPFVSFVVALLGTLGATALIAATKGHRGPLRRCFAGMLAVFAMVAVAPVLARHWAPSGETTAVVAVIQGSTPDRGLEFNARRRQVLDNHVQQTTALAADIAAGEVERPVLVIWPENSSDIDPLLNADAGDEIQRAADAVEAPILVGAILDGPGAGKVRNAGLMWFPSTGPGQLYVKRHPVPFAEYIPLRSFARHISSKVDLVGRDVVAGRGNGLITDGPFPFGDVICFEVTYDALVGSSVKAGAQMLIAQTNNATFGHTAETYQQLAISRLRAVETQRTVIEASTTGVSAVIDPSGRLSDSSGALFSPARLVDRVPLSTTITPGVRLSFGAESLLALAAVGASMTATLRRRRQRASSAADSEPKVKGEARGHQIPGVATTMRDGAGHLAEHIDALGRILVVIPTYNERDNIAVIVARVRKAVPDAHVLIVDDGSPDGTGQLADELAANDSAVKVMHRTEKAGLGAAYIAGFEQGLHDGYDVLVEMDADGSHAPEQLPDLLSALHDADLVLGSRWVKGGTVVNWPRRREILSRGGNLYTRLALGLSLRDATGGYRAYRRQALEGIDYKAVASQGYCFQVDLAWRAVRCGYTVVEVPITFTERERGESKMSGSIVTEALWRVTQWGVASRLPRSARAAAKKSLQNS